MTSSFDRLADLARQTVGLKRRRNRRRRTAFIFSGGGNLGAVQVGMLRALTEAGIKPDLVVGCSVGAINGAGFAAQPNMDGVERLDRLWRRIADGDPDLMPSRFMPVIAQMARKGEALHDQERLAELLDDELPTKTFGGLKVPFACVATDLETASEHWFEHGRLVPALLASAALPAVYPAFEHRGRTFIDGGVLNEIHTAQAVAMGADVLYILHVGHLEGRELDVQRPFDSAMRAYWTARRFRLEEDLRRIPAHCVIHRLPAGSNPRLRFDDFSQGAELADLAYDACLEYLRTGHSPEPVSGPVSDPLSDEETADAAAQTEAELQAAVDQVGNRDAEPTAADRGERSEQQPHGREAGWPISADGGGRRAQAEPAAGLPGASEPREAGSDRFARAFSRWGSSSGGRAEQPPGWDEPEQAEPGPADNNSGDSVRDDDVRGDDVRGDGVTGEGVSGEGLDGDGLRSDGKGGEEQ